MKITQEPQGISSYGVIYTISDDDGKKVAEIDGPLDFFEHFQIERVG